MKEREGKGEKITVLGHISYDGCYVFLKCASKKCKKKKLKKSRLSLSVLRGTDAEEMIPQYCTRPSQLESTNMRTISFSPHLFQTPVHAAFQMFGIKAIIL